MDLNPDASEDKETHVSDTGKPLSDAAKSRIMYGQDVQPGSIDQAEKAKADAIQQAELALRQGQVDEASKFIQDADSADQDATRLRLEAIEASNQSKNSDSQATSQESLKIQQKGQEEISIHPYGKPDIEKNPEGEAIPPSQPLIQTKEGRKEKTLEPPIDFHPNQEQGG